MSPRAVRVGLIGDYQPAVTAHQAIPEALRLSGAALGIAVEWEWIPTGSIPPDPAARLESFDLLWCVPASPYASTEGALAGIRFARERRRPFLGTCGGFQHALLEYARNVAGLAEAEHAETAPDAAAAVIAPLACSLVEQSGGIRLAPGSRLAAWYGKDDIVEGYHCRYGLNPAYQGLLAAGPLRVTGRDAAGEVRAVELDGHPGFVATLFQPERRALAGEAPAVVVGMVGIAVGGR